MLVTCFWRFELGNKVKYYLYPILLNLNFIKHLTSSITRVT
jgi:hypothetical protein